MGWVVAALLLGLMLGTVLGFMVAIPHSKWKEVRDGTLKPTLVPTVPADPGQWDRITDAAKRDKRPAVVTLRGEEPMVADPAHNFARKGGKRPPMPEHVMDAFKDYVEARLQANGNVGLPVKELLVEFARWHGPSNLDRGILRPTPPPIPENVLAPKVEGDC